MLFYLLCALVLTLYDQARMAILIFLFNTVISNLISLFLKKYIRLALNFLLSFLYPFSLSEFYFCSSIVLMPAVVSALVKT